MKRRLTNLLLYYNNILITKLLQELKIILLDLELEEVTKVLKNDRNNNINYLYIFSTFLNTKGFNLSNLDIKFILYKSQTY